MATWKEVTGLLVGLVPSVVSAQATVAPSPAAMPLSSYNWAATASPSLATSPPPIDTVRAFISTLDTANDEGMVCTIKFANFRNSGNLTLIAGHCGGMSLDIVDNTSTGFDWRELSGLVDAGDDVTNGVQDILGNGTSELVVHSYLAPYVASGHCNAVWPVIYAWNSLDYTNVSTQPQYATFYQQQLSTVQAQLAAATSDCLKAESAKIQRILGNPNAGIADATAWAASSNSADRVFAAAILADIATPDALTGLQGLTNDSDPYVVDAAQGLIVNGPSAPATLIQQAVSSPTASPSIF